MGMGRVPWLLRLVLPLLLLLLPPLPPLLSN